MRKVKQMLNNTKIQTTLNKEKSQKLALKIGSPTKTRTWNLAVNSRSLYH